MTADVLRQDTGRGEPGGKIRLFPTVDEATLLCGFTHLAWATDATATATGGAVEGPLPGGGQLPLGLLEETGRSAMRQQLDMTVTEIAAPTFRVADLVADLRALRKGRGVQAVRPVERMGPSLRGLCAIADNNSPIEALNKVVDWLRDTIAHLPPDLRISAVGAFGLHEDAGLRFLQDRVTWVARQLNRDSRTARRRMNEAIDCLAELAVRGEDKVVDLTRFVGLPVEVSFSQGGITATDVVSWRCHIVAVARDVDNRNRHFVVIRMFSDPASTSTIAIPAARIRRIAPMDCETYSPSMRELG